MLRNLTVLNVPILTERIGGRIRWACVEMRERSEWEPCGTKMH